MFRASLFWISFFLLYSVRAFNWDAFFNPRLSRAPKFSGSGFFSVDVGLSDVSGNIECFGDFNSDRYMDIFVVNPGRDMITLYFWDTNKWRFTYGFNITTDLNIVSITAADFNYDGKLDLLVQGKNTSEYDYDYESDGNIINLEWYKGNYETLEYVGALESSSIEVLITDINTDLVPDLLGQRIGADGVPKRYYWFNNNPPGNFTTKPANDIFPDIPLAFQHSNSFADFDGDCLSDLLVKSQNGTLEFYLNKKADNFSFANMSSSMQQLNGAGQITLADFDSDGAIDLLFPVCDPPFTCERENSIHVIYNVQKKVCQSIFDKNCRTESGLCDSDPNWKLAPLSSPANESVVIVPHSMFGNRTFYVDPKFPSLTIRSGDFDLDGYPDIIFTTKQGNQSRVELWKSVPCTASKCSTGAVNSFRRTFEPIPDSQGLDLYTINGTFAAVFFDFDEDGTNDILVMSDNSTHRGIHAIFNNINPDAFFFKTLGLNGVCTQWCTSGVTFPEPRPYGVNLHGASIKFTYADLDGKIKAPAVPQLPQSSHLALLTPYTLAGLGRPSNYISYFFLGVPVKGTHWFSWPGIIPNSQVVGIPFPPNSPENWKAELYLSLSGTTVWILTAIVGCLILLGIIIIVLTRKEKIQDEKEKKEKEHLFSFKAM